MALSLSEYYLHTMEVNRAIESDTLDFSVLENHVNALVRENPNTPILEKTINHLVQSALSNVDPKAPKPRVHIDFSRFDDLRTKRQSSIRQQQQHLSCDNAARNGDHTGHVKRVREDPVLLHHPTAVPRGEMNPSTDHHINVDALPHPPPPRTLHVMQPFTTTPTSSVQPQQHTVQILPKGESNKGAMNRNTVQTALSQFGFSSGPKASGSTSPIPPLAPINTNSNQPALFNPAPAPVPVHVPQTATLPVFPPSFNPAGLPGPTNQTNGVSAFPPGLGFPPSNIPTPPVITMNNLNPPNSANNPPPTSLPGFMTAADTLAETHAQRRGTSLGLRRPGLSKMAYNPPFKQEGGVNNNNNGTGGAPPQQPNGATNAAAVPKVVAAAHQAVNKDNGGDSASELVGVPEYLLNEDKTELLPRVASCDPKLLTTICREVMDSGPKITWDDIAGLQQAKSVLEEVIIWPLLRPDLFTGLRGPPKGIMLFGPPGTGKTLLAKAIASETGCTFFNISSSSLMSKWVGDGEKLVRCLFAVAGVRQPSVVFIDEIDSLLSSRCEGEMDAVRRVKTEFLVQLDGAGTDESERVLIIGATNRPGELDEAARRRLERKLYIPLPDPMSRRDLVTRLLSKERHALTESDLMSVTTMTEGYSGADLKTLCREAAMGPLRECRGPLLKIAAGDVRDISLSDFVKAVKLIRPTVSESEIKRYEDWNKVFGCAGIE